jgi:hypothetical protein
MLDFYIDACHCMSQHSPAQFAATVRILQRRIELISDKDALKIIEKGLLETWEKQPALEKRTQELEMLVQFARIRGLILSSEVKRVG